LATGRVQESVLEVHVGVVDVDVGQTMLSISLSKTLVRGHTLRGAGGWCGAFDIHPILLRHTPENWSSPSLRSGKSLNCTPTNPLIYRNAQINYIYFFVLRFWCFFGLRFWCFFVLRFRCFFVLRLPPFVSSGFRSSGF
jgi:hypothetical protein